MHANRTSVILAQYGQPQLTIACVESLRRHHGDEPAVVLVDDGSRTPDVERVAAAGLSNVQLHRRPHRGVTAAWDFGAAACSSDMLIFLNNDVVTLGPWVERLTGLLQDSRTCVAGVELRTERQVSAHVLAALPTTQFAAGWCFAVRRADFVAVGGFRTALRLYFSDTDLQARLVARGGCGAGGIAVATDLPVRHLGHATTARCPSRREQWQADRRRFARLWSGHR